MLRLIAAFIVGVYVGQEYSNIPKVKKVGEALYDKALSLEEKSNDKTNN